MRKFIMVNTTKTSQLLDAMPPAEWECLYPDLEHVELAQGQLLHEAGAALKHVYFPTTAMVSLVSGMQDGASAEVAVVGHEGVVDVSAFMGGGAALSSAVVQTAGCSWRMSAADLARHAARSEAVLLPMLRYTMVLFAQLAQTSACHRHHSLDQKLCCWLLQHRDRELNQDLRVTHEHMAGMLGVRRETVTSAALKLQQAGLIRYVRGCVSLLDCTGLEARSCECYAVVKSAYDRLRLDSQGSLPAASRHRHWPVNGAARLHPLHHHAAN
jgi:CRP-like cAMP-binding protein